MKKSSTFSAGDWVVVRSKEEILRTLDDRGQLDGLPFMPEMFAFCGRRVRVYKRAHKTCDTVNDYKGRRMDECVHLENLRCDGQAHDGCQAGCMLFWKDAWLKPGGDRAGDAMARAQDETPPLTGCTEAQVLAAVRTSAPGVQPVVYACQTTLLPAATQPLPWWSPGQYMEDVTSGNVGLGRFLCGMLYMAYRPLTRIRFGPGRFFRWLFDVTAPWRGGFQFPRKTGPIPMGDRTPTVSLNLQPGDLIRIRSYEEILATCDQGQRNRGLKFDAEMVPYCGGTYRVLKRVNKIINEQTGVMQEMKTPSIILDTVVCEARYSECRLFCPRAVFPYWREIWLERVSEGGRVEQAGPGEPVKA